MHDPAGPAKKKMNVAIIGGGISGLSAAYHLQSTFPACDYRIFESHIAWGGVLQTRRLDGFLIERSADSFLDTDQQPWAGQLIHNLGLTDALISTDPRYRKAQVLREGRLHDVPAGFQLLVPAKIAPILKSGLLSWRGKARLLCERFVPKLTAEQEETLAQFAVRRVGREAYERLVQPLVSGIYTADPNRLSMQAALPRFTQWEAEFGSLTAGLAAEVRARRSSLANEPLVEGTAGARYAEFRSLRGGMASLIECLVDQLRPDALQLQSNVEGIRPAGDDKWEVTIAHVTPEQAAMENDAAATFDAVILATAPHVAAQIVAPTDAQLRTLLDGFESASVAVVSCAIEHSQLAQPLECFGVVVPLLERRDIIAASFSSVKFAGRAPPGHELIRVFIGGACHAQLLQHDDETLGEIACRELVEMIGLEGIPIILDVARWHQRTPQYHLGHRLRWQSIDRRLQRWPGLEIAGNAIDGIGLPHCIHSGQQAAQRTIERIEHQSIER